VVPRCHHQSVGNDLMLSQVSGGIRRHARGQSGHEDVEWGGPSFVDDARRRLIDDEVMSACPDIE
jgi:hypothetical protein